MLCVLCYCVADLLHYAIAWMIQAQQCVAVVDPETRISFLFTRCRPTQPRYGVDPSVGLNYYVPASRAVTVVYPATATADIALLH